MTDRIIPVSDEMLLEFSRVFLFLFFWITSVFGGARSLQETAAYSEPYGDFTTSCFPSAVSFPLAAGPVFVFV